MENKKYLAVVNGEYVQVDGRDDLKKLITGRDDFMMFGLICQKECTTDCIHFCNGNCPYDAKKDKYGNEVHVLKFHEGEAVTLINPKGQRKDMSNVDFYALKEQFAKSKKVIDWSNKKNISLWIGKDKKTLSVSAVDLFLKENGYQVINNLIYEAVK